jgi:hypothetical protein
MSQRDELADRSAISLSMMANRRWFLFERRLHPPVYDSVVHLAEEQGIHHSQIQHFTAPEESFPSIAEGSGIAFLVKAWALLMARNGVTVRPLAEERLRLRTYLVSRADNESKVASELVRAFMRKMAGLKRL